MPKGNFKKGKKSTSKRSRKTSKKVTKTLKKYVKRAIRSNLETKEWTQQGYNNSISANTGSGTPGFLLSLMPTISQGTGTAERIGNMIMPTYSMLKIRFNLLPYNVSTNDVANQWFVKVWIASYKEANAASLGYSSFFQGNSSANGFNNNVSDIMRDVNNDLWTVHATRTKKLGASSAGSLISSSTIYDNSQMNCSMKINLRKFYHKQLKYNDTNTTVTNQNIWFIVAICRVDGTTSSVLNYPIPLELHYRHQFYYKDA